MPPANGFFSPRWDHLNMRPLVNTEFSELYYAHHCKRVQAIKRLLDRLPQIELSKLEELNRDRALYWFIPYKRQYGMLEEFPDGRMIYLSQTLELLSDDAVMGAVAHELAHLIRGHLDVAAEDRGESTTEMDADETVKAWKLGRELSAYRDQSPEADRVIWGEASDKLDSIFGGRDGKEKTCAATDELNSDLSKPTTREIEIHQGRMSKMEAQIHDLEQQGWKWSEEDRIKRVLMHPDDPEINIWFHPYSGEALLSPMLVERLQENGGGEKYGEGQP